MEHQRKGPDWLLCGLLFGLSLFFCWFEIGRFGIFGSSVDWISQHSVIPDYFRQQFYATGELFPEFAPGLGGGQNVYNFAYYGLLSPLILPSYLLPFVRMGDYLMVVSVLAVAASAVIFYGWQRSRGQTRGISFFTALLLLLSGPLIFQSARQVMFVNYMPFLCMALWGVDRYLRRGKPGVYLLGVFLMIMTSFYYSVGGMLALVIYGLHAYLRYWEHPEKILEGSVFYSRRRWDLRRDWTRSLARDLVWLLLPMLAAVLLSAFFLVPTAAALMTGERGGNAVTEAAQLFTPELLWFRHLYSSYGVGLTTLLITALISGLFRRGWSGRFLSGSCIAVLTVPVFMWLLNGGLYVREKALIPFLPLFCYVIACYCAREEESAGASEEESAGAFRGEPVRVSRRESVGASEKDFTRVLEKEKRRKFVWKSSLSSGWRSFWKGGWTGVVPYVVTVLLLCEERDFRVEDFLLRVCQLPEKLRGGAYLALADRWTLVLLDALLMLIWYILCRLIWRFRGRGRNGWMLLLPPILFLALFGTSFRDTLSVESREFYEQVNQKEIGRAIERVLAEDDGFYRVEQTGSSAQQAANINRTWNARQYSSSLYSSTYNSAYQKFRMNTFDTEEPAGNFMMQRSASNPDFQRLMGVRYLVKTWESPEMAADEGNSPFGYEWYLQEGCTAVYRNQNAAPVCYATDRLLTEDVYGILGFPLNQTILQQYAVVSESENTEGEGKKIVVAEAEGDETNVAIGPEGKENAAVRAERDRLEEILFTLPEIETADGRIEKTEAGYRVEASTTWSLEAQLSGAEQPDMQEAEGTGQPDMQEAENPGQSDMQEAENPGRSDMQEAEQSDIQEAVKAEQSDIQKAVEAEQSSGPEPVGAEQLLYLQFQVRNLKPGSSLSVWINGVQNTLSSASSGYFYYNHNTVFTYAVPLTDAGRKVSVTLGKGTYEITDVRAFLGRMDAECGLYQSELIPDWTATKGNRISGQITVQSDGCLVTSIPIDQGFEVKVDGKDCPVETVNTAFLGFSIGEGQHRVEIVYHAPGVAIGRLVSLLGLLLTLVICSGSAASQNRRVKSIFIK